MPLTATGISHVGCVRSTNQDSIAWHLSDDGEAALLMVADGMGGQAGGDIASQVAIDTLTAALQPCLNDQTLDHPELDDYIQQAINLASECIQARRADEPALSKMGTTIVLAWIKGNQAHLAHIGDSRCYLLSGDHLTQLTRDDTVVQNMLEDGTISEADAPHVPFRNVLTRALGSPQDRLASMRRITLAPGDRLLLCSDGLTNAVAESQWPAIMNTGASLTLQAQALIDTSLAHQAADNVSVVLSQFNHNK